MSYQKAISFNELYKAGYKCAKGVTWKYTTQDYLRNILSRTYVLRQDILNNTYKIQKYSIFSITYPKFRIVFSTKYRDRVLQKSMCDNGLYQEITKNFIYDNCACQKHKGNDFAKNRAETHLHKYFSENNNSNYGYCLKLDIRKFFDSIPHKIAIKFLTNTIKDKNFLRRTIEIINSFPPTKLSDQKFGKRGLALGSQISQLVALLFLNQLDHIIKEKIKIKHYVRYMDDFIIFHKDKQYLKKVKKFIERYLATIGLSLNNKFSLQKLEKGFKFLQNKFILTKTGKVLRLYLKKNVYKEKRKLKKLFQLLNNEKIKLRHFIDQYIGWMENVRKTDSVTKIINNVTKFVLKKLKINKVYLKFILTR